MSDYDFDWIEVSSESIAALLHTALLLYQGEDVDMKAVLDLAIPPDEATAKQFEAILEKFRTSDHRAALEAEIDKLDGVVGPALGLDGSDIAFIRTEMMTDPFLIRVRPRYPMTTTRIHGFRTGLDSSDRYG